MHKIAYRNITSTLARLGYDPERLAERSDLVVETFGNWSNTGPTMVHPTVTVCSGALVDDRS